MGQLVDILQFYGSSESSRTKLIELLAFGNDTIEDQAAFAIKTQEFRDAETLGRLVDALTKRIINGGNGRMLEYPIWRAQGKAVLPVLEMLEHEDAKVQAAALNILSMIDRNLLDDHLVEAYRSAIVKYCINKQTEPFSRQNALSALASLAIEEPEALNMLVHIATDNTVPGQHVALYLLSKSKIYLKPAVAKKMVQLLVDDRYAIRIGAFIGIRTFGTFQSKEQKLEGESAIAAQVGTIKNKNSSVVNRVSSASVIRDFGNLSSDEINALLAVAFDPNESSSVRYSLAANLIASGIDSKVVQNTLRKIIKRPNEDIMVWAMKDAVFRVVATKNYLTLNEKVDPIKFDMQLSIGVGNQLRTPDFMSTQSPDYDLYGKILPALKQLLADSDTANSANDFRDRITVLIQEQ